MDENVYHLITKAHRVVVKVGASSLTHANGKLNLLQLSRLSGELAALKNRNLEVILVSSGAIATGMGKMGLREKPKAMPEKQALAAIGQGLLMQAYEKEFAEFGMVVAQVLLTRDDLNHRERYLNARNTLLSLLRMGAIPIINENDTVAVEEIKFGENDTLAALVANLIDADLLILLSDIEGLYTGDPRKDSTATLIPMVKEITAAIEDLAGEPGSKLANGGMATKIKAAKIVCSSGIPMIVANGAKDNILIDIISGSNPGTLFIPRGNPLKSKKGWIAFASKPSGTIQVDSGAERAIVEKGKSLLPSGITAIEGEFSRGAVVSVRGKKGEIARGIVNYSFQDIDRIRGRRSQDILDILGHKDDEEVIHRDNMTLITETR